MNPDVKNLGPLAALLGTWEGTAGDDIAPSDDRGVENNKYREKMVFEALPPTENHEQVLYGLRYSTKAWRLGANDPFHEDMGYWLWDPQDKQVFKCFVIPRGITVMAGGTVDPQAKKFTIKTEENSCTYGVCHNIFLEKEFKIVGFELSIDVHDANSFSYQQVTKLKIKGQSKIFDHTDKNLMKRI